jgi:hypothetical protein
VNIKIIRTDGTEEVHVTTTEACMRKVEQLIGATCLDTVNLRDGRVMMVDDSGYETELVEKAPGHVELKPMRALKPVNDKATQLYWSVCVPGTTHQIVGDVAIIADSDLGGEL